MSTNEAKNGAPDGTRQGGSKSSRGKRGLVERLASVRMLLWVIGVLSGAMALATIVPQRAPADVYHHALGQLIGPLVARSALSDVYGAWWFIGGFALLAMSLLACSVRRGSRLLRRRKSIQRVSRVEVLARPHVLERRVELVASAAATRLREGLRNAGYAVGTAEAQEPAEGLAARRGLPTAWASVLIHIGMALVLIGAAYGRPHFFGPPLPGLGNRLPLLLMLTHSSRSLRMSALGHKQTFGDTPSNVRYWGLSGHPAPWAFMSAIGGKADIQRSLSRFRRLNVRFRG